MKSRIDRRLTLVQLRRELITFPMKQGDAMSFDAMSFSVSSQRYDIVINSPFPRSAGIGTQIDDKIDTREHYEELRITCQPATGRSKIFPNREDVSIRTDFRGDDSGNSDFSELSPQKIGPNGHVSESNTCIH